MDPQRALLLLNKVVAHLSFLVILLWVGHFFVQAAASMGRTKRNAGARGLKRIRAFDRERCLQRLHCSGFTYYRFTPMLSLAAI